MRSRTLGVLMRISMAPSVDQIRSAAALAHSTASLSLKIICMDGTEVIVGHGNEARVNPCHFRKLIGDEDFTARGIELISSLVVMGASRVLGPGLMCVENQGLEHYRFVTMLDLDDVMSILENCVEDDEEEVFEVSLLVDELLDAVLISATGSGSRSFIEERALTVFEACVLAEIDRDLTKISDLKSSL
ncbi:MAG: hypothetical protein P8O86_10190 [Actinomycetota bacterium]|nr:hypothetical protein [Actinomycetota bacterium]